MDKKWLKINEELKVVAKRLGYDVGIDDIYCTELQLKEIKVQAKGKAWKTVEFRVYAVAEKLGFSVNIDYRYHSTTLYMVMCDWEELDILKELS